MKKKNNNEIRSVLMSEDSRLFIFISRSSGVLFIKVPQGNASKAAYPISESIYLNLGFNSCRLQENPNRLGFLTLLSFAENIKGESPRNLRFM